MDVGVLDGHRGDDLDGADEGRRAAQALQLLQRKVKTRSVRLGQRFCSEAKDAWVSIVMTKLES